MIQTEPVTPRAVIDYHADRYSEAGRDYLATRNMHVGEINQRLSAGIPECHTVGDTADIEVLLPGISQLMLLDLVVAYREAGWNVVYGCGEDTRPYMVIGLSMRS